MQTITFDFIIIGSGLAGLASAYHAAKYGKVALITKSEIHESNSFYAQGGIACVTDPEDKPEFHINDTLEAGRGLCRDEAVEILINEGRDRIDEIIKLGMKFDRDGDSLSLGLEGGHSKSRILHSQGNSTGKAVVDFFIPLISKNENIEIFENYTAYKLFISGDKCKGCFVFDSKTSESCLFAAPVTEIASGGVCAIYKRNTNPEVTTGDGIMLAYEAGAELAGMEFVQFHPTSFFSDTGKTFLISEAMRGEGAYLIDNLGRRFMEYAHPLGELAPRDVVSKEIFFRMEKNKADCVFLKTEQIGTEKLKQRFKNVYEQALQFGVDITIDPIPVAPAAHYMMGGIYTDLNGKTTIDGLYACGEAASTGVHGANRLASNSLLECLVFSKRAVENGKNLLKEFIVDPDINFKNMELRTEENKKEDYLAIRNRISEILNEKVGIVRDPAKMQEAIKELEEIRILFNFSKNEIYSLAVENLISLARLITTSALERKESRGGHLRTDITGESETELTEIIITKDLKIKRIPIMDQENLWE